MIRIRKSILRGLPVGAAAFFAATAATLLSSPARAQSCPPGSYCYYVPPILNAPLIAPANYGGDIVLSAPSGTISGTYSVNGGASNPFSVSSGTPQFIVLGANEGQISGFLVAEQRGTFIVANSPELTVDQRVTALAWQSSSTVKSNVVALGTRFRAGGYTLNGDNGDGTGYDFISFFAPTAANITVDAPSGALAPFWNDGVAGLSHTFSLQAGQTYLMRSVTGADIDGALITSDQPVSVAIGGRGWDPVGCGDDGMDHLVPTALLGTQFVVDDLPSTSSERVRVVTDTNGTDVFVNGALMATINAGESYDPAISGLSLIESSQPAYVFQNAGRVLCENDVALIPPVSFANVSAVNVAFNVIGNGEGNVLIPTLSAATLQLDGAAVVPTLSDLVPGHPEWTRIRFSIPIGTHSVSAQSDFQFAMVSDNGGSGLFAYFNPYRLPGCGDGTLDIGEGCDDANPADGDGCSAVCQVEPYHTCSGSPSVCVPDDSDGDGMPDLTEILTGYDPLNADADNDGVLDPNDLDLDNDGIPNTIECNAGNLSLINGSFELPDFPDGAVSYADESQVPGWDTTASDNVMEFWGNGFLGVPSADGTQFVELNANEISTLFQDIATTPGAVYFYRFYHRGRDGDDVLALNVGDPAGPLTQIRQITTGNSAWQLVTGVYTVPAGQSMTRFAFESVSSAGGGSSGNFLDGIAFTPGCTVDTDGDGTLDFRDSDSDADTIPDGVEAGHGLSDPTGLVPGPYGSNGLANSVEGAGDTGVINYTVADTDTDGTPDFQDVDSDNDGDNDNVDNCVLTPNSNQADQDSDGTGDVCDDSDSDGVFDSVDNCLTTPNTNQADGDNNGIGDACQDIDNDTVIDINDNCPTVSNTNQADGDNNGIGDACQDSDNDTVLDITDNCPTVSNTNQADGDNNGVGDACQDIDNDTVIDINDNCPTVSNTNQADGDNNGIGDACQDGDNDTVLDITDNCPTVPNANQADVDNNGIGDACQDTDNDTVIDINDNCPTVSNTSQADTDGDNVGDQCDDEDLDGVVDISDNCPTVPNADQADTNMDNIGDACQDADGDGVVDPLDNCVNDANPMQEDADGDMIGDACDDGDGDTVIDIMDNCPDVPNTTQEDTDGDGVGDACQDTDGDGVLDVSDNCPSDENADQADADGDQIGDICDDGDGDGVIDIDDNCPKLANSDQLDSDRDKIGDACDPAETGEAPYYGEGSGLLCTQAPAEPGGPKGIVGAAFAAFLAMIGLRKRRSPKSAA